MYQHRTSYTHRKPKPNAECSSRVLKTFLFPSFSLSLSLSPSPSLSFSFSLFRRLLASFHFCSLSVPMTLVGLSHHSAGSHWVCVMCATLVFASVQCAVLYGYDVCATAKFRYRSSTQFIFCFSFVVFFSPHSRSYLAN